MAPRNKNSSVPDGWTLEKKEVKKGKIVEYYRNALGQNFYSMEDLMRYVNYAMKAQLSIYAPPSPTDGLSTARPCSKGKRKRTTEKSSSKKEKQKKTNSTAKNGGTKKNSIIKTDGLSTAKPCSEGKRRRTIEKSSSKKEKQKKTNSIAKNGGAKKNSIIKFRHIFYRLSQQLNKVAKRQKHANCSAQRQNIKDASDKTLPHRASRRLARNAPKYGGLDIAATTYHVPNSPARQSLALTVIPPRASRRLSRQAPEYVPDFDPLLKY